jgi:signal transduction histidine kinase
MHTSSRASASLGPEMSHARTFLGPTDELASFRPAILGVRWATTAASVVLAAAAMLSGDWAVIGWAGVIVANAIYRSNVPLRFNGSRATLTQLLAEVALATAAVAFTGFWASPLVFTPLCAVIIAGFARGFGFASQVGIGAGVAISLPYLQAAEWASDELTLSAQWMTILGLVGVVAGFSRRISGEADLKHSIAIDRLSRLSDANALLFNLHRVAQTLPASLDYTEVLESSLARLRGLVDLDAAAILVREDLDGAWVVARRQQMPVKGVLLTEDLPISAQRAIATHKMVVVDELGEGNGLSPKASSAIYAPLMARGSLIGILAVEGAEVGRFTGRDREVVQGFVEPVALAIDNAKWFSRLKTVSADEERSRIARDLHDRIGQSLAYLGFELDRVVRANDLGNPVDDQLEHLRTDLRGVISEVRDTLYDLRTDVGSGKDFASTIDEFSSRVAERAGFEVALDCDSAHRLPILQEREMWRIAQEALINVERHADAKSVEITWRCDGSQAMLEVADNGRGFVIDSAGRLDSYGILGMRERASSIGASLQVSSAPQEGTTVRCFLTQD